MVPFDPRQMAMNLISQNPNIANNPNAQEFIKVIQNGDSERGQQIAYDGDYGDHPRDVG